MMKVVGRLRRRFSPDCVSGPVRHIRIVCQDEKGRIHMDPETVVVLQLIKEPVGVVPVCGPARRGQNFIFNQGTYSTHIFLLAVQLSSMFICEMGGIDEAALDCLSLVATMIKHICVRASGGRSIILEWGQLSSIFVWLLRDVYLNFVQDNQKITPCVSRALRPVQGCRIGVAAKNGVE